MRNRCTAVRLLLSAALCAAIIVVAPVVVRAEPASDFKNVVVFPNPYRPASGHASITFENVTDRGVRLRVFKITGVLVADISPSTVSGSFAWDVTDSDGKDVASGVYVYLLTDDAGNKAQGKIAIVR